ncbi:nitrate reductase delta subunit [Bacillus thermophilus]|uniref:Nitrate reductase delta subunit n=1 Tax=Siminovitchia thermophila TaxID=1245522 RepID=A0ABS2REX0_9BACI|nr:nitrate reductase molybdenum cofactor assembly chaperone [Siminovitchia thermophila]MBM7717136.1 nitrate reductase delta subunit [Siminovitchia thermophila]ONK23486.1 nitrate reductase molybdenum cofactor assembly chaperone [Bacillus sp. VT-16-64]
MNPALNYQLISFLLQYPDRRWEEGLPDVKLEIEQITYEPLKEKLVKFVEAVNNSSSTDWLDRYIETFDFGRATNLYVTYLKQGEKRERGMELLQLKKIYQQAGFTVTDKELPDYLPAMLEFCAQVPTKQSNELLANYGGAIWLLREKLHSMNNDYGLLLDALFIQMDVNGVNIDECKQSNALIEKR